MKGTDEIVLYYGLTDGKQEALLLGLLGDLGIKARPVRQQETGMTVGQLAGSEAAGIIGSEEENLTTATTTDSILVMAGLSDDRINTLLAAIRQTAGLTVTLKAVLTEHNSRWSFTNLAAELRQEHAVMQVYTALHQIVRQAEQQLAGAVQPKNQQQLRDAVRRARQTLTAAQKGQADARKMAALGREIAGLLD